MLGFILFIMYLLLYVMLGCIFILYSFQRMVKMVNRLTDPMQWPSFFLSVPLKLFSVVLYRLDCVPFLLWIFFYFALKGKETEDCCQIRELCEVSSK